MASVKAETVVKSLPILHVMGLAEHGGGSL